MTAKLTVEEVQTRLHRIHDGNVSVDIHSYINTGTKCRFLDKEYGEWYQKPNHVLKGHKHPRRAYAESFLSLEEVREAIQGKHGDTVRIDESTYVNMNTRCRFIDVDHGEWFATPGMIVRGHRHRKRFACSIQLSVDEVERRLFERYKSSITLKRETYINVTTKCVFVDVIHGEYGASPHHVLEGSANHPIVKRIKHSLASSNMLRTPKSHYSAANGSRRVDLDNQYFRSAWEANYARYLTFEKIVWEYESKTFPLSTGTSYTPDFFYSNHYVEIKGRWYSGQREKIELFLHEYPHVKLEIVEAEEYRKLAKRYKMLIPEWEGK